MNSYSNASDILVGFHSDEEIAYDYHDVDAQRQIVRDRFADAGAPFSDPVDRVVNAETF